MRYPISLGAVIGIAFAITVGCEKKNGGVCIDPKTCGKSSSTSGDPLPPPPPPPEPPPEVDSPFYFEFKTTWTPFAVKKAEDVHQICSIPKGSAFGTSVNCVVQLPEGQLHYSDIHLKLNLPKDACEVIYFYPYYYQASADPKFRPLWNSSAEEDCTKAEHEISKDCFNGPAKEVIEGFPQTDHRVLFPNNEKFTNTFDITSSFIAQKGNYTNRYVTNTLIDRITPIVLWGGQDGHNPVLRNMQDWRFKCADKFDDKKYEILMILDEIDGVTSEFQDWLGN